VNMFIFGFFIKLIFHFNLWMETGAPGGKPPARGPQKTASHRELTCVEIVPVLKLSNLRVMFSLQVFMVDNQYFVAEQGKS